MAFALLGIALAGLCPLVTMHLRQVRRLERRFQGQLIQIRRTNGVGAGPSSPPAPTYYIVPWKNPWARKLAGGSSILESSSNPCDPGLLPVPSPPPTAYPVSIVELDAPASSENVTAFVEVSAP